MSAIKVEGLETIEASVKALEDTYKNKMLTISEKMEAAEKQLEDQTKIIEGLKQQKETVRARIPVYDENEAWGTSTLKDIPDGLDQKQVHEFIITKKAKDSEVIKGLQTINDDVWVLSKFLKVNPEELKYWHKPHKQLVGLTPEQFIEKTGLGKALSTATGDGGRWVPTGWGDEMLTDYEQALLVADAFESFEMPQDPFNYPFMDGSGITSYLRTEPTENEASKIQASQPTDQQIQFSTIELASRVLYSRKLDEDALSFWLPALKKKISRRLAEDVEDAIINGDVTATHQDSDVISTRDHRKAWKGLRKWASSESTTYDVTTGSTVFQASDLMEVQAKMVQFGVPTAEGVWFFSNIAYIKARAFDEFETFDKAGDRASLFTGQIGIAYGWPVIVSPKVRTDLNASGVYDGTTTTKTEVIGCHYPSFKIGYRREEDIETDRDINTGQNIIVASMRLHFRALLPTGNKIVGAAINI